MFANSKDVAAFFGKRHDHVLRDINELLTHAPNLGDGLLGGYFTCVQTPHPTVVGRMIPSWDMTKDGFTLLVMGYTGPKAMAFKVRYIEQFNKMEEALRNPAPALPDFTNPVIAARAWADEVEKRQQLALVNAEQQKAIAVMTPKVGVAEVKKWRMRSVRERRTRGR